MEQILNCRYGLICALLKNKITKVNKSQKELKKSQLKQVKVKKRVKKESIKV